MTESDGEAVRRLALQLKGKLDEFQRCRSNPHLGMESELPALANLVELMAYVVLEMASKR